MRRAPISVLGLLLIAGLASSPSRSEELRDLYFGEALYYAHQGLWFEALERLDAEVKQHNDVDEPQLDTLYSYMKDAEFSLGDFELRYRMHLRAGRAIKAVLEGDVDDEVRNDAAYRLARIHFQKNQLDDALRALDRISGKIPESIRDDIEFLRANVYLGQGRPNDSVDILKRLQGSENYGGFASYNLGIAYLKEGRREQAIQQLDRAGGIETKDPAELAIRDKSNLVLGTMLLESGDYEQAIPYLNRVRIDGPFSDQALLSSGWANMSIGRADRAVVPWKILAGREVTDRATQEAMLALPYAYGKLNIYGRAAVYYGRALDSFGAEIDKLNKSIDSIRDGKFLNALTREEIRQNKDWVIRLRSLPDTPETYYMMDLLASHDFQTGLQNYLDLTDLHRKLLSWQSGFDAYDEMVQIRREHYKPLLPDVDTEFRELDSRLKLRIEQHKMLAKRRDDLLTTPRPEFLATREEQLVLKHLEQLESALQGVDGVQASSLNQRIKRLKGLLTWTLVTEYDERLTRFDENLRTLDEAMAKAQEKYDEFVRTRQAATLSYEGYEKPIRRLRAKVAEATADTETLIKRQGHLLEVMAVDELVARRDRLEKFGDKARFALADSYDRATQAQARAEEPQ